LGAGPNKLFVLLLGKYKHFVKMVQEETIFFNRLDSLRSRLDGWRRPSQPSQVPNGFHSRTANHSKP
jgi:hypothetical protein